MSETAEAAGAELVGQNVREKPEPGEEGGPPKAASSRRAARSGRAGCDHADSPSLRGHELPRRRLGEAGFIPPDSMGAVGPTQIVVDVNGGSGCSTSRRNIVALDIPDAEFWTPALRASSSRPTPGSSTTATISAGSSPRSTSRSSDSNNRIMLAVSDGPTITDESSFTFYWFNEESATWRNGEVRRLSAARGRRKRGVHRRQRVHVERSGFAGGERYVMNKNSVETGPGPGATVTGFPLVSGGGPGNGLSPARDRHGPDRRRGVHRRPRQQVLQQARRRRITDPGGTPSLSGRRSRYHPHHHPPLPVPAQGATGGWMRSTTDSSRRWWVGAPTAPTPSGPRTTSASTRAGQRLGLRRPRRRTLVPDRRPGLVSQPGPVRDSCSTRLPRIRASSGCRRSR